MRVVRSIEVDAPPSVVWELLSVFKFWPMWGPSVRSVRSEWERVGPGVSGKVDTPLGVSVPFEITSVDEGVSWDWRVGGFAATGHRLRGTTGGKTFVEFSVPGRFAPYAVVLKLGLRRLAELAESGDSLGTPDVDRDPR